MTSTSLNRPFRLLLVQLLLVFAATSVQAMHRDSSRHDKGIWKQLGLSDQQQAQVKEIRTKFRKQIEPLEKELKTKHQAVRSLEKASKPDQAQINKAIEEMQSVRTRVMQIRSEMQQALRNVLDEAQKKKFDELSEKKHAQRHHRGGKHHHPH
jgi:protein CpxP